ncbi:MAG: ABC transporter permease [Bacteroidetes bacterium]|nr:ABC transporter permease [Bacteroidota bacterium]
MNIVPVIVKEFRQLRRDKRILTVLLFIPGLMLFMFGYALNFDVKHTRFAVYDEDRSSMSRSFIEQFTTSEYFDFVEYLTHPSQIDKRLDGEQVRVVLVIPSRFSYDLARNIETKVQVLIDGTNSTAGTIVLGYVNSIVQQYSLKIVMDAFQRSGKTSLTIPIDYRPRLWYNPELKSAKFMVPGLIAFIMMVTAVISTALSVVRERELGTMEQLLVAPLSPAELIIGKTIPYIVLSIIATIIILGVGFALFDVTIKGSILLLSCVTVIYLVAALGMGLFISTIAETQQVAFMIAAVTTLLPTFILSGFVFPIRNMPEIIQVITYLVPARYFLVGLRSIILKGVGIEAFWDQVLYLTIFTVIILSGTIVRMKKALR